MTINILTLIQCHIFFKTIVLKNDLNAVIYFILQPMKKSNYAIQVSISYILTDMPNMERTFYWDTLYCLKIAQKARTTRMHCIYENLKKVYRA